MMKISQASHSSGATAVVSTKGEGQRVREAEGRVREAEGRARVAEGMVREAEERVKEVVYHDVEEERRKQRGG